MAARGSQPAYEESTKQHNVLPAAGWVLEGPPGGGRWLGGGVRSRRATVPAPRPGYTSPCLCLETESSLTVEGFTTSSVEDPLEDNVASHGAVRDHRAGDARSGRTPVPAP
jgi:hypothetical protein